MVDAPARTRTGKKPPVFHGRDKFSVPEHPWITGSIPLWAQALADVNQDRPRPTQGNIMGVPNPRGVLGHRLAN